jgi:NADPH:quinone reductase-like Zn-dependent oxidoreductase
MTSVAATRVVRAEQTVLEGIQMKAIVQDRYGPPDVLRLADVDIPEVEADSVLVRVKAASVNAYDWHMTRGQPFLVRLTEGLRRPKNALPGVDLAGVVEAVGGDVTEFKPGDEVFGARSGAFRELVRGRARNFHRKPATLTFEQASGLPMTGVTALQALRDKGGLQPGQSVLITGAAGGVGTAAIQIAKALGAHVTAVCGPRGVELVRSIGADRVIDYSREDYTRTGDRYDLIIDIAATTPLGAHRRILRPDGTFVIVGARRTNMVMIGARLVWAVILSRLGKQQFRPFLASNTPADHAFLAELAEAGKLTPVIDSTFPLADSAEALRHQEQGHPQGKVVITM